MLEIGWSPIEEIEWSPLEEIRWVPSEEILHLSSDIWDVTPLPPTKVVIDPSTRLPCKTL
jgi:hypothetical protein